MPRMAVNSGDTGVRSETPESYTGYEIEDPRGRKVGSVKEVFVCENGDPQYIELKRGLFGLKTILLPVQSVRVDKERRTLVLE